MKKFILFTLLLVSAGVCNAQINGNGYYRVKNNKSTRYIYITDGTSSGINVATTSADMGAVELYKDNNLLTNPASVIYAEQTGDKWNLSAQGTGVYQLIGHYVDVKGEAAKNAYQVSASASGVTLYLYDGSTGTSNRSQLTTGKTGDAAYRVWNVHPLNQTDNYIGVLPSVTVESKHYAPYYVSFPFQFHSTGMKAYYISKVDTELNVAVLKEVTGIVPSSTPVIIECSSTDAADNKLQLENYNSYKNKPADNKLAGTYFANKYRESPIAYKEYNSNTMRVLGVTSDGKLGFVTATTDMLVNCGTSSKKIWCIKANASYLVVPEGTSAELGILTEAEYAEIADGIEEVIMNDADATYYSIDGKKMTGLNKGLNIVRTSNGKVVKVVK